ncbi:MAG: hypothetical protein GF390_00220, partial [Candidatus Pacebacteria bacterium]|nr:hypothetical protein [Candidatus Paceibacterota bacterium]
MSVHYYPLVNKVMTALKLRENLDLPEQSDSEAQSFTRPFVTVAREPGSGGAPIAKLLAKKLGFG